MLSVARGYAPDYLLKEVATGRENYYTGAVAAGEPPGRWYGSGAEALGLTGLVDGQDMRALYERFLDPRDPAFSDPERWDGASRLGHTGRAYKSEDELYAEALEREPNASAERRAEIKLDASKRARKNVAFFDATFSVQKSITVLHAAFEAQEVTARTAGDAETAAAWATHRQAVEEAIWAGNRAGLDYLAEHAGYSRIGHHGGAAGRYTDAHDWTIASFFQHDNREHEPQLHIHNAILNRVAGADGKWRTLDGRGLYAHRGAAAAVAERTTEELLTHSLGTVFATRPDGKSRELLGVPAEVMELFSARRRAITGRTRELVEAFEAKFGREPNALERDRLQRQATFATRKAKTHDGESAEARLERWDAELRAEVAGGLGEVAETVLGLAGEPPAGREWSPRAVIETALADVQSRKSAWTAPDLTRAISDALPDHLGLTDGDQVTALLESLTAEALQSAVPLDARRPGEEVLPADLRVANGASAYDAPGRRLYATPEHVRTERTLSASAARTGAAALPAAAADAFVAQLAENGHVLGADQAAAVRGALTSGAAIESLVGPAGTGKSFTVGMLAKAWQDPTLWSGAEQRVFGLASSQIATDNLAGEGVAARNVARWLATQDRLADGRPAGDDETWRLRTRDLVVVDESAMADTADLAAIHGRAEQAGAKLLLVGDHRQLAAVGAGGGMDMLATAGASYELADARRFSAEWERAASLRLREGDETVLEQYHQHGRLLDCGALEQAEASAARAWLGDTLAGKQSVLLVDTNEQAARLSAQLRAELVRLGQVGEHGVPLGREGTYAGAGDIVQARRNGWDLAGYAGNTRAPINRQTYRVLATREDGGLQVAPITGHTPETGALLGETMTLPGAYVSTEMTLGYAATVHAAQGRTVDTSHAIVTGKTGPEALYVGLSRGRECNTAHVTTRAVPDDAPSGEVVEAVHKTPAAVLAETLDGADPTRSALATATASAEEMGAARTPAELFADAVELATAGRTSGWLDQLAADGVLTGEQRARLAAEDGAATLSRVLRRAELAGHDPRQVLADAVDGRSLSGARQLTNVLYHRIQAGYDLDPAGDSYAARVPAVDDTDWRRYLQDLADTADARQDELGRQVANDRPQWAVEALGPVPAEPADAGRWVRQAGAVVAHRELAGHDDEADPLGPAPKPGQVEAYASWRAAWQALGWPDQRRDELEMSDGQLRVRIRAAQRETAWAPRYVGNELAGTRQAAETARQDAAVRAAEATTATDAEAAAERRRLANQATALADTLDHRAAQLHHLDDARAHWLAHTAQTRAAADRAEAELSARHADDDPADEQTVTAEEWLAAHHAANAAEDPHRQITADYELADIDRDREADHDSAAAEHTASTAEQEPAREPVDTTTLATTRETDAAAVHEVEEHAAETPTADDPAVEPAPQSAETAPDGARTVEGEPVKDDRVHAADADDEPAESAPADVRDVAADEPTQQHEDDVRVPSADETAGAVQRAQRALTEIAERQAADEAREAEEAHAEQLARWQADDRAAEQAAERAAEQDAAELDGAL